MRVSSKAMDLLRQMLEKDPDRRISSDDALMHPALETMGGNMTPIRLNPRFDPQPLLDDLKRVEEWS